MSYESRAFGDATRWESALTGSLIIVLGVGFSLSLDVGPLVGGGLAVGAVLAIHRVYWWVSTNM